MCLLPEKGESKYEVFIPLTYFDIPKEFRKSVLMSIGERKKMWNGRSCITCGPENPTRLSSNNKGCV